MKRKRKLIRQLYPSYVAVALVSVAAMAWIAISAVSQLSLEENIAGLKSQALLVEDILGKEFSPDRSAPIDAICKKVGSRMPVRITVMTTDGKVLGDSDEDPARMGDHSTRPEVKEAMAGKVGTARRYSFTLNRKMVYVAIPLRRDGELAGIVRTALPVTELDKTLRKIFLQIAAESIVVILLTAGISLFVANRINRTIAAMKNAAVRFAGGDLQFRLKAPDTEEMSTLAEALNTMAAQLHERLSTITSQRNQLEAVLSNMIESVLVTDEDGRITRLNQSAEKLLGCKEDKVRGRTVQEAVRNTALNKFVRDAFIHGGTREADITFVGNPDRYLQAHGTKLDDASGRSMGALVVLNDVTRLKNLERIRRDFVANVSHELKTPITSIKGFLETLKDGALHDPENADRFLSIILKQTDRMNMIIEDLLTLSRIERDQEQGSTRLERGRIIDVLEAVKGACLPKAEQKDIELHFSCEDAITARINARLLEQAIANLVDNAIKYSGPGSKVEVSCKLSGGEIIIEVADQGVGIEKEHLERIFERFYRVDKARSNKEGGTGLGLAIVRHIVNSHNGEILVASSPGEGSTFTIRIPAD